MTKKGPANNRRLLIGSSALVIVALFVIGCFLFFTDRAPAGAIVVPRDFSTVKLALEHVLPGGTIIVRPSNEPFEATLVVDTSDVTIAGSGQQTVIEAKNGEPAITISANGVTIRDIMVKSNAIGVKLQQSSNITLKGIVIEGAQIGIQLIESNGNVLNSVKVRDANTGIDIQTAGHNTLTKVEIGSVTEAGIRLSNAWSNNIHNTSITGAKVGISLEDGSEQNELLGCMCNNCSTSGVEMLSSSSNTLRDSTLDNCGTGILLSLASGNTIENNTIKQSVRCGISLYKSQQNSVSINTVSKGVKDGIALSDSQENSISHNVIEQCIGTGLVLGTSRSNLILNNSLTDNAIGLQATEATRNRILRNELSHNLLAGLVLSEGEQNLLLDNYVFQSAYGIALIESRKNQMLRNHLSDISAEAVSLLNHSDENLIQNNAIAKTNIGLLAASSSHTAILDNYIATSQIAVKLFEPGTKTMLEGNSIMDNSIGIQLVSKLSKDDTILRGTDSQLLQGEKEFRLIITSNTFANNDLYDISNLTSNTVFAGGNHWGNGPEETKGVVSAGVILPSSTWKGTIALGTTDSIDQIIMGRLLQLALAAQGIKVISLIGLGDQQTLEQAMTDGDVHLALANSDSLSKDTFGNQNIVTFPPLSVENKLIIVVSETIADALAGHDISYLASFLKSKQEGLNLTVQKGIPKQEVELLSSTYGIELGNINWTDGVDETETELKLNSTDACIVHNIEETLTMMGFHALEDDQEVFPTLNTSLLAFQAILDALPEIELVENTLRSTLTTTKVHSLVNKVRLLHSDPAEAAGEFMLKHELISQ